MSRGLGIVVKLVSYTLEGSRMVAASAKVSLSRKPVSELLELGDEEVEEWIRETFKRQHFSPWEHSVYTFIIDGLSRVASHQLVRHRVASYTQQSHRYTEGYLRAVAIEASKTLGLDCPEKPEVAGKTIAYECYSRALRTLAGSDSPASVDVAELAYVKPPSLTGNEALEWARSVLSATASYYVLLSRGVRMEDARYIIPSSVRTRIVVTMNARELIQVFLPLRMCSKTQWELRHIAWLMWKELRRVHPTLFKWAGPRCVLAENSIRDYPVTVEDVVRKRDVTIPRCPELVDKNTIPLCVKQAIETSMLPLEFEKEVLHGV